MKKTFSIIFVLIFLCTTQAQSSLEREEISEYYKGKNDTELLNTFLNSLKERERRIENYLNVTGSKRSFEKNGKKFEIIDVVNGEPILYKSYNLGAAQTIGVRKLNTDGSLNLNLNGQGMIVGVWDAGTPLATHEDLEGRMTSIDFNFDVDDHATHVMGTIISSGLNTPFFEDYPGRGMAYEAESRYGNWTNDLQEMNDEAADGLLVSNHSYGYNYDNLPLWEMGAYDTQSKYFDDVSFLYDYYQIVVAAGNDRRDANIYNPDKGGYDLITGKATAKNVITVGAVLGVDEYLSASSVNMSTFSNWGPTDDGRIKPDIVAKGVDTFSCQSESNTAYGYLSGTSMATPSISGMLLLLQQHYNNLYSTYMKASTLKGLLLHTSREAGLFQGPDYRYGWGLPNAEVAANTISNIGVSSYIEEKVLNQNNTEIINVLANGNEPLKVSISWTDASGTPVNQVLDSRTPTLVNDLDIKLSKDGVTFYPWKLTVSNPDLGALRNGTNDVDNYERVDVDTPNANDSYQITISHKGQLEGGQQNYSLIITGGVPDGLSTNNVSQSQNDDIVVFPNPITTELSIKNKNISNSWNYIEIFDSSTKLVHAEQLSKDISFVKIPVSRLNDGIYFLRIYTNNGIINKKVIKK